MLVPPLSVAENIFLGDLKTDAGLVNWTDIRKQSKSLLHRLGALHVNVDTPMESLGVAQQQLVTIARALRQEANVLIMDEPTSSLTPTEIELLFENIRSLQDSGVSIIYISHRLEEVKQIGSRITVMRDGRIAGHLDNTQMDKSKIIRLMVGRDVRVTPRECRKEEGEPVFEVKNLSIPGKLENISFSIHRGEVVGVAGLVGAGRTDMARLIFGADKMVFGDIYVEGKKIKIGSPLDAINAGIALVPEDRKIQGLIGELSVQVNSMLVYGNTHYPIFLELKKEKDLATKYIQQLEIKTPSLTKRVMELSGGNQQKVVLAKWLCMSMKVLIFDEVTRGIDVGAKAEIYKLIDDLACAGYGILMISSELQEILTLSDRVLVMHGGRITGEYSRDEATQEKIMASAIGGGR
jgi:ABC-type sugar transport system ATPase subunit